MLCLRLRLDNRFRSDICLSSALLSPPALPLKCHALKRCTFWRETCLASAFALRLANQRARASTLHTRSKETILSESRDVAKRKKDSMTAIFPLYCKIFCKTKTGNVLLSQAASHQVSSALRSLTTVFEMGTGVTSSLLSPDFQVVP